MRGSASLRPSSDELRARLRVNLRELRQRAGISQQELAFRADVHPSIVAALELEQKLPRIDTFIRLAGGSALWPRRGACLASKDRPGAANNEQRLVRDRRDGRSGRSRRAQ